MWMRWGQPGTGDSEMGRVSGTRLESDGEMGAETDNPPKPWNRFNICFHMRNEVYSHSMGAIYQRRLNLQLCICGPFSQSTVIPKPFANVNPDIRIDESTLNIDFVRDESRETILNVLLFSTSGQDM